jgi:general secretion pathway protein A
MFLNHFGLREQPFGVTPDPRFLYLSPPHLEALASLFYGIQTQRGFMALIAKPGMGKTTLLFHLLENMRDSARTAFLFQAHCDAREFLRSLMSDLGVNDQDDDLGRMHRKLNEVLIRELHAGRRVVVVIDEAQNLDDSVLETVRMLSNFEIPGTKLMQILIAGQPQLADKLASRNMVQLRQRISILSRLTQFSASETADYIGHRLRVAGYRGNPLFTPEALAIIHARSGGIPRNINNLCFHASTLGFANGQNIIDAAILSDVLTDLDMEVLGSATANEVTCVTHSSDPPMTPRLVTSSKTSVTEIWWGGESTFPVPVPVERSPHMLISGYAARVFSSTPA